MRKAIETAPRNGVFVILEDDALGTFAVARWSVEATQWLDDDDKPIQLNATHWTLPQNLAEKVTPRRPDAADRHPPIPASSVTAQPQPATEPERSVNVWTWFAGLVGHAFAKVLSPFARVGGWVVHRQRSILTATACLVIGAALAPMLYRGEPATWLLDRAAPEDSAGLRQALELEQERANKLANDVTAARREAEAQATLSLRANEAAVRQKEASELTRKTIDDAAKEREQIISELRQTLKQQEDQISLAHRKGEDEAVQAKQANMNLAEALQRERNKVEELRTTLAVARREGETQAAAWRSASSEAKRLEEASGRVTDALREALRQAEDKAEKLATELAAMRREAQTQMSAANSAKAQAAGVKEAADRSADEQRRALQQERDKTAKLTAELAETRSSLQAQAKAKAADDVARENQLATARGELQKATADAAASRESLEAERSRTEKMEQRLITIEAATKDRGGRLPEPAAPAVGPPPPTASTVASPVADTPAEDAVQPPRSATRPQASVGPASPHAVRLIARANLLLDQGNIGAARNMLDRAAEMGSPEALFWLAETYDPLLLPERKTLGTQSDIARARDLYGKALAGGVSEARLRLEALQK